LLKDQLYLALVYMAGILPIRKYGTHSTLNMFSEYSMLLPGLFAPYIGFTEGEVKKLCTRYEMNFEETKSYYNGYKLFYISPPAPPAPRARHDLDAYNPKSVVEAMRAGVCLNYWNQTETYEALSIYIKMNIEGLKEDIIRMMAGESKKITISSFTKSIESFTTVDEIYTLLIHLGYLTYDDTTKTVRIPNKEVGDVYIEAISDAGMTEVANYLKESEELLQAVWNFDAEKVAASIDKAHQEVPLLNYNNEHALGYTVSLAFYYARNYYTIIRELPSGKGFADIAYIPRKAHADKPALIIELKYDKNVKAAISQIKEKNYPEALAEYKGNLLLVGINYDKESKQHSCVIEKVAIG
jgi:hypothetical protein